MTATHHQDHHPLTIEDHHVDSGSVRILRLDRPAKRNALDTGLLTALQQAYTDAAGDDRVRAIVLQASGPIFCAGGDTSEFGPDQKDEVIRRAEILTEVLDRPGTLPIPVVAAVQGPALGAGAALALSADLVVAGRTFSLGYPELPNGAYPPLVMPSALKHLNRTVAFELVTTGRRLGADEALAYGVINHVVDDAATEALVLATRCAALDPVRFEATKTLFRRQLELPESAALHEGLKDFVSRLRGRRSASSC